MSTTTETRTPSVQWAQRDNRLLIGIMLSDCADANVQLNETKLTFTGRAGADQSTHYRVELDFYKEIDPAKSRWVNRQRFIDCVLYKKEEDGAYWPRLLSGAAKPPFLKIDFTRWRNPDDSDADNDDENKSDIGAMMQQMGGFDRQGDADLANLDYDKAFPSGASRDDEDVDELDDNDMPPLEA